MSYNTKNIAKYRPKATDIVCLFRLEPNGVSLKEAAVGIAEESSTGTWTPVKTNKAYVNRLAAKVFDIKGNYIKIAYPLELFELGNIPQLLSSVAGNIFGMKIVKNLRLEDIHLPRPYTKSFKGPHLGIDGIRKLLRVKERPLLGTIVKPKLGLKTKDHAEVAYEAWAGGCDIVKDDENLSSQTFNPFYNRVIKTLEKLDKAESETGERKVYMANITAPYDEMLKRAQFVKDHGGRYIMIDILTIGWSALQQICNENLGLVIHAHRAMHGALTHNPRHGISMLALAKLARLAGVDQLHIGTVVGKMQGNYKEVYEIEKEIEKHVIDADKSVHALSQQWYDIKPVFSVCSGGLHPGHVPKLIELLGKDIIIQMGGGIHGNKLGTKAGALAARQAIYAAMHNIPLKLYAKEHMELAAALETWLK